MPSVEHSHHDFFPSKPLSGRLEDKRDGILHLRWWKHDADLICFFLAGWLKYRYVPLRGCELAPLKLGLGAWAFLEDL